MYGNSASHYRLSWQPDKDQLKAPIYLSLANLLEADIRSGSLASGTKLPPQRELADYLNIHFTTVTRAYEECKKRNLIHGITGSGTFVSPQAVKPITNSMDTMHKHNALLGYSGAIEMGFASSFEQTNSIVSENLPQLMPADVLTSNLGFSSPTGTLRHKEIARKWMSRLDIHVSAEQVAFVSGSMNALTICFLSLFKSGDRIATDYYINNNVIELAKLLHIQLIPIRMDQEGMLPEDLDHACQQHGIKGVYLMPSCNNPTTIRIPFSRKLALSEVIKKHNLLVLEDDHYGVFAARYTSEYVVPMRELLPEQTIYICTTTTPVCSAIRVAFLAFPFQYRDMIYGAICNINVKTSALDVEAICQLIESGVADQIVEAKAGLSEQANAIFNEIFPDNLQGLPYSFFRWLEIPAGHRTDSIGWELLAQGVHVYHSRRFTCGKPEETSYLRIALSSAESPEQLREGLLKIRNYLSR